MRYVNNSKQDTEEKLNKIKDATYIYIRITCHSKLDSSLVYLGEEDLISGDAFSLQTILNPSDDLSIGNAVASEITLNLLKTDKVNSVDWNADITVELGYKDGNSIVYDGIGMFYGKTPSRVSYGSDELRFVGYDRMVKYGSIPAKDFLDTITWPVTNSEFAEALAEYLGISVTVEWELFNVNIFNNPFPANCTIRDIIAWFAELNGANAIKDVYADDVRIIAYHTPKYSVNYTLTPDDYYELNKADFEIPSVPSISYVDTIDSSRDTSYPAVYTGTTYKIVDNPIFRTFDSWEMNIVLQSILNFALTYGATHNIEHYIPMSVQTVGNYMVDVGDIINVEDLEGNIVPLAIFSRTLTWSMGHCEDYYECTGNLERREMTDTEKERYYLSDHYATREELGNAAECNVANDLLQTTEGYVLDARQGKELNDAVLSRTRYKKYFLASAGTQTHTFTDNSPFLVLITRAGVTTTGMTGIYAGNAGTSNGNVIALVEPTAATKPTVTISGKTLSITTVASNTNIVVFDLY